MKILHFLFRLLKPEHKVTWLSSRFARWDQARHRGMNSGYLYQNDTLSRFFDVKGAGLIRMSNDCDKFHCGGAIGFEFGVEWGGHGYISGVLGRSEAKKMALFILEKCNEITESEECQSERERIEREKYWESQRQL